MRLLQRDNAGNYSLTSDLTGDKIPPYAILSHTWGPDEVVFTDIANTQDQWHQKAGYAKILFCADQARRHGLQYFWVDTCCIDKSDQVELQRAINSMFRWYRDAKICYVYLSDVSSSVAVGTLDGATAWETAFRSSRWFTRGWTLQELIAPTTLEFYSREGIRLGDKKSLEHQLRDITGIPASALRGTALSDFTIAEREAWACNRETKYEEDMVYSLLGIFDVHMPLVYGEGRQKARRRLREEAQKVVKGTGYDSFSITFSLSDVPDIQHFVARGGELAEIREALRSDGSRRAVILHGLGGIGKTQLAVAYAKRYRDEYSAIFWLNIKDETSIQQSFTKVAKRVLQQHPHASPLSTLDIQQDRKKVAEAVLAWLSLLGNTRWLLIYDNYDNPKLGTSTDNAEIDIGQFLPEAYQGSIVVTTRSSQVDIGHRIRIRKLESIHDSLQILATTSGRECLITDANAKMLVEKLDGLPLALATAGTYLRHVSISFAEYLRLYKESWERLHMDTPNLGSYRDRTLCSTWQLSYVQIQKQHPLAAHLLRWWAYFNNEDIWFELLQFNNTDSPAWISELADELNFNHAMGTLHDYGFVEAHMSTLNPIGSRGYSMHACVHSWTVSVLNKDADDRLVRAAVACVAAQFSSKDEHQFWALGRRLLPHAIKCSSALLDSDRGMGLAFCHLGELLLWPRQARGGRGDVRAVAARL
ncbi:kinesin light chain 1 [Xylaria venustula]|nr:kinesin light chain 1 [Xylaria venustula]